MAEAARFPLLAARAAATLLQAELDGGTASVAAARVQVWPSGRAEAGERVIRRRANECPLGKTGSSQPC
jgi:hypothetical protein